jgi:hypothetical protein
MRFNTVALLLDNLRAMREKGCIYVYGAGAETKGIKIVDLMTALGEPDSSPQLCPHGFRGSHMTSTDISGQHERCPGPTESWLDPSTRKIYEAEIS